MNANTAEIIDLATYRDRRAQPAPGVHFPLSDGGGLPAPGLMMMPVPVFFVWPMAWFAVPVIDDA